MKEEEEKTCDLCIFCCPLLAYSSSFVLHAVKAWYCEIEKTIFEDLCRLACQDFEENYDDLHVYCLLNKQ